MKTVAGLWIDHRKAIIVTLSDKGEKTQEIFSDVEKQHGRVDGVRSVTKFESQLVAADDSHEREFTGLLKGYYEEVIAAVRDAGSILLLGPGEAKVELKKLIEQNDHANRTLITEIADKMTDRQISAKIGQYFTTKNPKGE
jgi:hypothetical protein